jgi:DNA polymerase III subunit epsilon
VNMQYAIVDIETTGGNPSHAGITEIAVLVYDGEKVIETYQTLINPERQIPGFITGLTGIDQEMVAKAPTFSEIAPQLYKLLENKVFIAHNVNFDYSFIKEAFLKTGYQYLAPKACTVRLSRKVFPGYKSYSLGRLCEHLNIPITSRHRAFGDAAATAELFGLILARDPTVVGQTLKKSNGEVFLPPNISKQLYLSLPEEIGIYFFHDAKGNVIYVGKALNIRSRFKGHFSGNSMDNGKLQMKSEIHDVSWQLTGSEFLAFLLEMLEIKRLWPKYNRAQKFSNQSWGLIQYEDNQGFIRFQVAKVKAGFAPVYHFENHAQGWKFMMDKIEEFHLCAKLSGIQTPPASCFDFAIRKCKGACCGKEDKDTYNIRAMQFLHTLQQQQTCILIKEKGRHIGESAALYFEKEVFAGYAFVEENCSESDILSLIHKVKAYTESKYILRSFLQKIPNERILIMQEN